MQKQTFHGFQAETALRWLGSEIKSLAEYSSLGDQEMARAYHLGTHTIAGV